MRRCPSERAICSTSVTHEKIRCPGFLSSGEKTKMALAVGGDHAGFALSCPLIAALYSWRHTAKDCGADSPELADFPDIAQKSGDPNVKFRTDKDLRRRVRKLSEIEKR
jgi:hypothetical protein